MNGPAGTSIPSGVVCCGSGGGGGVGGCVLCVLWLCQVLCCVVRMMLHTCGARAAPSIAAARLQASDTAVVGLHCGGHNTS